MDQFSNKYLNGPILNQIFIWTNSQINSKMDPFVMHINIDPSQCYTNMDPSQCYIDMDPFSVKY